MRRVALFIALAALLVVSTRAQQTSGNTPRFTGKTEVMESKDLSIARRRFDAGARTAWHSHDRGQLLFVEQGRMRAQKRGEPIKEYGVGESDYAGADVVHWHGAAVGQSLVQLNVGFGGGSKWFEDVTDAEYLGKSR